ncbi:unnamed protein product [Adineta steineri]|uniref:Uncharacterized protein n=1 Tax=Adineta steineri TaxID=433720 RepID=A0A813Q4T1_9BILA|nr:unnamed protein product [Adineta steineri]CAF0770708.1 unnamed protein product [Adineta steineri]
MNTGPRQWPHLVGRSAQEAVQVIRRDTGLTNIQIMQPDMMGTMDYRTDRVRIQVDQYGRVSSPPTIG